MKKAAAKKDSSSDSDSSSDAKPVKKAAPAKKAAKKDSSSDSESSSDAKPVKKAEPKKKAAAKKESSSDSDSDSESEKPKKKAAKKDSSSDSESVAEKKDEEMKTETPAVAESDEHDGKTELFVQGMDFNTDENSLNAFFGKFGELTKCKVLYNKGKAFIEFGDHATARKAQQETNQKELDGRSIWVEFSGQAAGGYQAGATGGGEATTIFVGNLGFRTEQWAIEEFFKGCGQINGGRIAMGEDGRPRGFAHVEFESNASAVEGMKLAG